MSQHALVLDGQNVVQEIVSNSTNNTPVVAATYLSGPNGPIYRRPTTSADVRWYLYDGGMNVVGEVNALGNVTGSKKHDVYGATRSNTGTSTSRQGWQGGVGHSSDEETGLTYMQARYYAPELGRFQNEDKGRDEVNWFIYCGNDPVNKLDRDGKVSLDVWLWTILGLGLSYLCFDAAQNYARYQSWADVADAFIFAALAVGAWIGALGGLQGDQRAMLGALGVPIAGFSQGYSDGIFKKLLGDTLAAAAATARFPNGICKMGAAVLAYSLVLVAGVFMCDVLDGPGR